MFSFVIIKLLDAVYQITRKDMGEMNPHNTTSM